MGRYRARYDTDLTSEQWKQVRGLIPVESRGRKRKASIRRVLDALFYMAKTGCQWRYLPTGFPPRSTVNYYFNRWRDDGTWKRINEVLVTRVRRKHGREACPTAAICDAQSIATAEGGEEIGFDGGKRTKGRKRQVLVDVMGNILAVHVHRANLPDGQGARRMFEQEPALTDGLKKIWADGSYGGEFKHWMTRLAVTVEVVKSLKLKVVDGRAVARIARDWGQSQLEMFALGVLSHSAVITNRDEQRGFRIVGWRWIVERSLAWLKRYRRLQADYEKNPRSSEAWCQIASTRMSLTRLT